MLTLAFVFAVWFVLPPAGIPASLSPVAGEADSTGWLFGSADNGAPDVVGVGDCELRVNAKMTPKITSRPTIEGINTFQGLKLDAVGTISTGGEGIGGGRGVVSRLRTTVSSSRSSTISLVEGLVSRVTGAC